MLTDTSMRLVSWFMSAGRAVLGIYDANRPPAKHLCMRVRSWWLFLSNNQKIPDDHLQATW